MVGAVPDTFAVVHVRGSLAIGIPHIAASVAALGVLESWAIPTGLKAVVAARLPELYIVAVPFDKVNCHSASPPVCITAKSLPIIPKVVVALPAAVAAEV